MFVVAVVSFFCEIEGNQLFAGGVPECYQGVSETLPRCRALVFGRLCANQETRVVANDV